MEVAAQGRRPPAILIAAMASDSFSAEKRASRSTHQPPQPRGHKLQFHSTGLCRHSTRVDMSTVGPAPQRCKECRIDFPYILRICSAVSIDFALKCLDHESLSKGTVESRELKEAESNIAYRCTEYAPTTQPSCARPRLDPRPSRIIIQFAALSIFTPHVCVGQKRDLSEL